MTVIDDLLAAGRALPAELKPVLADLQDVVAGIADTLHRAGVLTAKETQAVETTSETVGNLVADITPGTPAPAPVAAPAAPEPAAPAVAEPETVGSQVFDITPGPAPAPEADPLATYTVQQLTDELARRQQAAVVTADSQRSQVVTP